jgi:hypothetical protein
MNGVAERRRRPRAAPGSGGPAGTRRGTEAEWVIRSECREGRSGFGIFLPTGEHIGFERDRRLLLDLLAGAGVSQAACETLLSALEGSGEARAEVFVPSDAAPPKAAP